MGDLSANFSRSEFRCKGKACGCTLDTVDAGLLELLEEIRLNFGAKVKINSGCRCVAYNAHIGGSKNSQHLLGRAADIVVEGISPDEVADFADNILEAPGLGRYNSFSHIDSRTGKARWDKR